MATTRIMPLHIGRGRSIARALNDSVDYAENPLKTDGGEWISCYECDARTADNEFLLSKQKYKALTGRDQGKKKDVIAYHVRQSFLPGEITPEEANRIGYETAMRFTKGRFAFIVCTHTDKAHIHTHIIWNSTALDCKGKFRNFLGSAFALRRCSDLICAENGYSVIKNPKPSPGRDYGRYMFPDGRPPSFQQRLRRAIDAALEQKPATFEEFLNLMRAAGCTVIDSGKHLKFYAPHEDGLPDQQKPTRCDTLRGEYTVAAIHERIAGRRASSPAGRMQGTQRPSLLIDIESKMREGKGPGYERWAKLHNLKMMAKTLIYLQEKGLDDYAVLKEKTESATARFNELSSKIKEFEAGLTANAALQKHIVSYSKTRQTYIEYRKAGYSKKFKELHEADIIIHQTAKKAFDELGYGKGNKLPTVASLRAEYAKILEEKKQAYKEYQRAKSEMRELLTAKTNVDRLLNITDSNPAHRTDIQI